jgi:fibronectin type 3 domain-containing protein
MTFNLNLSLTPSNQQVSCALSWNGNAPSGIIEYIVLYYQQGTSHVLSQSSTSNNVVISGLTNDTIYCFSAMAYRGSFSSGQRLCETAVQTCIPDAVPNAPSNLMGVVSTSGNLFPNQVNLSWTAPSSSSNYPILNYNVYQNGSLIASPTATNYQAVSLVNGTSYAFYVTAVSAIGQSSASATINKTPVSVPDQVQNVIVNYDASVANQVDLTYNAPNNNGVSIVNYSIQYSLDASFQTGVYTVTSTNVSDTIIDVNLTITPPDLTTSTGWYFFQVCANSSLGSGPFSPLATIAPSVLPLGVSNLAWVNKDANGNFASGTVTLSWDYAIDNACPLLGYLIAYLNENGCLKNIYVYQSSVDASYTISGLQNGFQYDMSVIPLNSLGSGLNQDIQCTPSYIPDPINDLEIAHANHELDLAWSAPNNQGTPLEGYKIYRSGDGNSYSLLHTIADPNALTYADTSLTNGTVYYYYVTSYNANSESSASNVVSEYPSTVPFSPSSGSVTLVNHNGSSNGTELLLSWSQNPTDIVHNGGSAVQQFIIMDSTDSTQVGNVYAVNGTSNYSYVLTGLTNGESYSFELFSQNRDGNSSSHTTSGSAIPSGLPDAPVISNLVNSNSSGDGEQATINWSLLNVASGGNNVVPSNEGSAISHYKLYMNDVLIETANGSATSYIETGVVNGQVNSFTLSAVNANGEGPQSAAVTGSTACAPDAVNGVSAVHGDSQITVSWNLLNVASNGNNVSPSDEGAAINGYIAKCTDANNNTFATNVNGSTNSAVVTGLTNGMMYSVVVEAQNAIGNSYSSAISCKPSRSPDVPRNINIQPYDSAIEISWASPALDISNNPNGGLAFTFSLRVLDQSSNVAYSEDNITGDLQRTISGLADNATYNVELWANNNVDTDYNVYSASVTIVANPTLVGNLSMTSMSATQINLRFSYQSALYAVQYFLMAVEDVTLLNANANNVHSGYAIIDPASQLNIVDGLYTYSFALTPQSVFIPELQTSDELVINLFVVNNG